ncbi:MAG: KamA family radical SAM protein [bacterium]
MTIRSGFQQTHEFKKGGAMQMALRISNQTKEAVAEQQSLLLKLWDENQALHEILSEAAGDDEARYNLNSYFWLLERNYDLKEDTIHSLELVLGRQCLRVAQNIISRRSQRLAGFNLVNLLRKLARTDTQAEALTRVEVGFLMDLERLWAGCRSNSGFYEGQQPPDFLKLQGREAALAHCDDLDRLSYWMNNGIKRFPLGLEPEIVRQRSENRMSILTKLGASEKDWQDWHWQLRHIIRTASDLRRFRTLRKDEYKAVRLCEKNHLPFGVTPFYLHLMDAEPNSNRDRAIRFQVIPPLDYARRLSAGRRKSDREFDFMQERDTSPADLITRRYPMICILKPYNSCAQICVYCQRNWEIESCLDPEALALPERLEEALRYIQDHPSLNEVLITGGDPFIMSDRRLKSLLDRLAEIAHIERIRFGTRTPVVLPMRITDELAELLSSYQEVGRRDVCVITHFEHPYEITPEAALAVRRLRAKGISVYNQAVFTFANSRRFEMTALRRALKIIGVDPYYTFATKGKEETQWYRIPIARLLQERNEEARLSPGTWRTDDIVFNVPRLGKNYLNRQQDHHVIALLPDGRRVYEFHPWEKRIALSETYLHTDISIYEYLKRLREIGEDVSEYSTIWYYY